MACSKRASPCSIAQTHPDVGLEWANIPRRSIESEHTEEHMVSLDRARRIALQHSAPPLQLSGLFHVSATSGPCGPNYFLEASAAAFSSARAPERIPSIERFPS
jgi:hypothetical protein